MDLRHVTIEETDGIALVRFRSARPINLLSEAILNELTVVARAFEERDELKAVVLAGGDAHFSAGMDLAARAAGARPSLRAGPRACAAWEAIPVPTIAAIEGHCIGGGIALAVACDFRIAGSGAGIRVPELALGMNMSWQSLPRFTALMGPAKAKRLVMMAERIDAATALDWGLVDLVVPEGRALDQARAWAGTLAGMPPLPMRMTKKAINAAANALNDAVSHMDADQLALCLTTDDFRAAARRFAKPT